MGSADNTLSLHMELVRLDSRLLAASIAGQETGAQPCEGKFLIRQWGAGQCLWAFVVSPGTCMLHLPHA